MIEYKVIKSERLDGINDFCIQAILENGEKIFIPADLANSDYQAYLAWIAEGNEAEEGDN